MEGPRVGSEGKTPQTNAGFVTFERIEAMRSERDHLIQVLNKIDPTDEKKEGEREELKTNIEVLRERIAQLLRSADNPRGL